MSAVEFDKRKYSTDSEYMIQNFKEKKNLEKWQGFVIIITFLKFSKK